MTSYVIESGIPIPACKQDNQSRPSGPKSELAKVLLSLEVGQSFGIDEERDYTRVRAYLHRYKSRRFVTRKLPREGWRVWRVA